MSPTVNRSERPRLKSAILRVVTSDVRVKTTEEWAAERDQLLGSLVEFADIMDRRPFQNEAGLRGVSAFALYWFMKRLQPTLVFEVGVWRGFSTWLIEQAVPDAEIWSFDPIFFFGGEPQPTYRTSRARYFREDFSCADLDGVIKDPEKTVVFFDDHHRQLARLDQARRAGLRHIVFDDNPPMPYSHRTLEDERRDPARSTALEEMAESYEVFPALWPVDEQHEIHVKEEGLGFPVTDRLQYLYDERKWHSYVTYVRATAEAVALPVPAASATTVVSGALPGVDIHIRLTAA